MAKDVVTDHRVATLAHGEKIAHELDAQHRELKYDAQSVFRSVNGRRGVHTQEQWDAMCEKSREDYASGRFLVERLGAERHLDPEMMAVLIGLRQSLLPDNADAAQMMLADLAVLAYYNCIRLQGWTGSLCLVIERELFGQDPLHVVHGRFDGTTIEDRLRRFGEQLLPLQDRANRMMARNLKALAERQVPASPAVSVTKANQVNVGHQQVNVT